MLIPDYVTQLHAEYERIVAQGAHGPDESRSVAFYLADTSSESRTATAGQPVDQITRWIQHAHLVDRFIARNGRLPRRNSRQPQTESGAEERRLAVWLEEQRRPVRRDRLCIYQRRRIDAFPGMDSRDRDERWWATYDAYASFLAIRHRAPAARNADRAETALALWATRQRRAHHAGTLAVDRTHALERLPIWTWGSPRTSGT